MRSGEKRASHFQRIRGISEFRFTRQPPVAHEHSPSRLPPHISPWCRHHSRPAFLGSDDPAARTGRHRAAAPDDLHQHHARPAHAEFVPGAVRQELQADTLPRSHSGFSQRIHRLLRPLASRGGWRTFGGTELPHGRAAPACGQFQEHHLARSIRHREARAGHAVCLACALVVVEPRAILHARRRADSAGGKAIARFQKHVYGRHGDRDRRAGAAPQAGREHHGHGARRGEGLPARPREK